MFHPGGIMLWVQQARCCHDIYLMRSKALHKVPGRDMILWTNFIIVTPLTSGRYTDDEFGSSYPKWSLTSFVLSLPFYPPPLLPPAIALWVCLYHILETATSKLCPRSKLTEAMWLHWHQAWANNPSWEGFFFSVNSMGRMSIHLPMLYGINMPKEWSILGISAQVWSLLLSFFLQTDFFPCPVKKSCTHTHNPHGQQNPPEWHGGLLVSLQPLIGTKLSRDLSQLCFLLYQFKQVFHPKKVDKMTPSFR